MKKNGLHILPSRALFLFLLLGMLYATNLHAQDSDLDGVENAQDLDDDNDGIPDGIEGAPICTLVTNINTPPAPTPPYTLNSNLVVGGAMGTATLNGLDNGMFNFLASVGGTASWNGGVQIQNQPSIGNFIYAQPQNTDNTGTMNVATYELVFPSPVTDFSFILGGLNNGDMATVTAFLGVSPIQITQSNFSDFSTPGLVVSGNSVTGTIFDNSPDPLINTFKTTIYGLVDRIVVTTGKSDDANSNVTIGLYSFGYCTLPPDADFDGDGVPNYLDLDSDNDGILDIYEAGGTDTNRDGKPDNFIDADNDGLHDAYDNVDNGSGAGEITNGTPLSLYNTDGNGNADFLDIDSDDDGIVDNIEGQLTGEFQRPLERDVDMDGIDDQYDIDLPNSFPFTVQNTDGDTLDDYRDLDSDDDTIADIIEGWDGDANGIPEAVPADADADGDGLDDNLDTDDARRDPSNGQVPQDFPDAQKPGDDRDWRQGPDHDNDGIFDNFDFDNDNDGIPDTVEGTDDFDNDGLPNYLDLDSDNDGITDTTEAGGTDANGDGIIDGFTDTDNDGLNDAQDNLNGNGPNQITNGTPLPVPNTDGNFNDGPNFLDIDADDDGLPDNIEAQATFAYIAPTGTYGDNGLDMAYTTGLSPEDTDGDGIPDYLDSDSDNDGIDDRTEGDRGTFTNVDADGDGLDDGFEGGDTSDPFDVNDEIDDPTQLPDLQLVGGDVDYREVVDTDGDGVLDHIELADGTNPVDSCNYVIASITQIQEGDWALADCDGDGVTNQQETIDGTNPEDACDHFVANVTLVPSGDYLLLDCDGDGVINGTEITDNTDPADPCDFNVANITAERTGSWLLADCDGDTIANGQELTDGTLPDDPCSSNGGTPPAGSACDVTVESDMVAPGVNNGIFQINNIENFPNNTVRIFNRWGVLVFETQGYDNGSIAFRGISNGRATMNQSDALPVGVYFYVIEYHKNGNAITKNGYLYVNR